MVRNSTLTRFYINIIYVFICYKPIILFKRDTKLKQEELKMDINSKIEAIDFWKNNGHISVSCFQCATPIHWGSGFKKDSIFLCDLCVGKEFPEVR